MAILVVAADDGIEPPMVEAIRHLQGAGVPLVVAATNNEIDQPAAKPEVGMQELGPPAAIPEGGQAGRGGRAGAEIWGKALSQGP